MAKEFHDAVEQQSTSGGSGNVTLETTTPYKGRRTLQSVVSAGAVVSYRFAAVDANDQETGEWETGEGTYLGGNVFARTSPSAGSSPVPVNFSAGTKKFTLTANAADLRPLAALTAGMALAYNADKTVASVTVNGTTDTLTYVTVNGKKRVSTITGGGTTTTVSYNSDGTVASIS